MIVTPSVSSPLLEENADGVRINRTLNNKIIAADKHQSCAADKHQSCAVDEQQNFVTDKHQRWATDRSQERGQK